MFCARVVVIFVIIIFILEKFARSMASFVSVLLPLPFDTAFTYRVVDGDRCALGQVVKVPFGRRQLYGVVWSLEGDVSLEEQKIKPIMAVVEHCSFADSFRRFIDKVASYTMSPKGMVLKMALSVPAALEPIIAEMGYVMTEQVAPSYRVTAARKRILEVMQDGMVRSVHDIAAEADVSVAVVKQMALLWEGVEEKEVLSVKEHTASDERQGEVPLLSDHQQEAVEVLCEAVEADAFRVTLIDGVTGSGKTEVYFAAIEEVLSRAEGQVLVLLPEIVLTTQLVDRFTKRFGFVPAVWHSMMSPAKRRDTWRDVASGKVRLLIGARSALFLPYCALRLMVIDEEHEAAYKQEDGVLYHARDMAVLRAQLEQFPVILASATPSVETVVNVQQGRYDYVSLPVRHGGATMPDVSVIDMRQEGKEVSQWVSGVLRREIADVFASGRQSLLFLNRRGYAPLTLCRSCGERVSCYQCASWMVEHREAGRSYLQCHHCGTTLKMPESCDACGVSGEHLVACGPGVERIVEEVQAFLPDARVVQMTSDSISSAAKAQALVRQITDKECDVIVGTQMIAKGYHFPYLALVGVIDADLGLAGGDVRAAERTYQLLHQVSGRAGREQDKGYVYLQSYMPDNAVIQALANADRDRFYAYEIDSRKAGFMPPFSRLVALIVSSPSALDAEQSATLLVQHALFGDEVQVLGPAPAPLYKLRGNYRYRLLIKAPKSLHIQAMISQVLARVTLAKTVTLRIDVDPFSFF